MTFHLATHRRCAFLATATLIVLAAGCRRAEPPPIVLISIDTLRSDRLPAYGYAKVETPAIDRLRRDGVLFERAYSHIPLTLPSHSSMLTGLLPPAHGVRDNIGYQLAPDGPRTLPERLAAAGYATGGGVSALVLGRRTGIDRGFGFWNEPVLDKAAIEETVGRAGAATWTNLRPWLEQVRAQQFFLFFHLYEPHYDWAPPEPYRARYGATYEGEIATADAAVGELLADLDRLGLYESSVIVLTSDHGEGLGDHGELEHGLLLYREALQIPLIIKLPGQARQGATIAEPAQIIDLAPTLMALARVEQHELPGRDLIAKRLAPATIYAETYYPQLHFNWSELRSAISGPWHLIEGPPPALELYDLIRDAGETQDLTNNERRPTGELRAFLHGFEKGVAAPREVDEETAKALGALGYLGSVNPSTEAVRPHPRDKVREAAAMLRGLQSVRDKNWGEAVEALQEAVERDPKMGHAWHALGTALEHLGRHAEAADAMARAEKLSPVAGQIQLGAALRMLQLKRPKTALEFVRSDLAQNRESAALRVVESRALLELGQIGEARAAAERALTLDPKSADAHYQRGVVAMTERQAEPAVAAFERAIALDPNHIAAKKALATVEFALGHPERARQLLEEVLALVPGDEDAKEGLALLDRRRAQSR